MKHLLILPFLVTPALFDSAEDNTCSASKATSHATGNDIVETAVAAGSFKTLAAALGAADLVGALQSEGPFTVFAPNDDAFAALPKAQLNALLEPENKGLLTSILTYHVVAGDMRAADVVKQKTLTTLNGQRIDVQVTEGGVMIDGAKILTTDIECDNGVIHVIDSVILPATADIVDTAVEAGSFGTLVAAVKAAGLVEALKGEGPLTVFAPTDEAFAALPEGTVETLLKPENKDKLVAILKLHVAAGRVYGDQALAAKHLTTLQGGTLDARMVDGKVMIGDATVIAADVEASNGVIHVIDRVLLP